MKKVVLLFEHSSPSEARLADTIENALQADGFDVHVDRRLKISVDWARAVDQNIRTADAVIVLLSGKSSCGEMLSYEMEIANDAKMRRKEVRIILVAVGDLSAVMMVAGKLLGAPLTTVWTNDDDTTTVIAETLDYLTREDGSYRTPDLSGGTGGGVSIASPFYIERPADHDLAAYLHAGEPTILLKGARQTGKTSLVARGMKIVKDAGYRACLVDFQRLGLSLHLTEGDFYRQLASLLARQMATHYELEWDWGWEELYGPPSNLDEFVRSMIAVRNDRLVWFMDEADCLFSTTFAESFFGLVRSWHNARAFDPDSAWGRLSVVITYATEAHLFIPDINQSPFNVGRKIEVNGFTLRQMDELNRRYGEPLRGIDQVMVLHDLLDGQPFLSRIAFEYLVRTGGNLRALSASADQDDGPFGDHLRRVLVSVEQMSRVRAAVQNVLANEFVASSPEVDRLVASGILTPNPAGNHLFRCKLYRSYLARHLRASKKT